MPKPPTAKIGPPFWVHDSNMTQQLFIRCKTDGGVVNVCAVHASSRGFSLDVKKNVTAICAAMNKYFILDHEEE